MHRSKNPSDWLFYSLYTGNPIRPSALTTYVYRLCWRLGYDPKELRVHPHAFRHLRATELYKTKKISEKEMMKLFGWKTRKMIDRYARIVQEDVEESILEIHGLSKNREEYIYCPRCGSKLPIDARYCWKCGLALSLEEIMSKDKAYQKLEQLANALIELFKKNPELLSKILSQIK